MSLAIELSQFNLHELVWPKRSRSGRHDTQWDDLLAALSASLNLLANLAEDWDGYGAPKIDLDQLEQAGDFLSQVLLPGTPAPSIVPTPSGGVQIEWHAEGIDFEVRTTPDSKFELSYVDSVKEQEWDDTLGNDWSRITEVMRELRRRRSQNL